MTDDIDVNRKLLDRIERDIIAGNTKASSIAEESKLSEATISRFRRGKASLKTIDKICKSLKLNTDGTDAAKENRYGYLDYREFESYAGLYLWLRPIFDDDKAIGCYPVEIFANKDQGKLELKRFVFDRRLSVGDVYINDRGYLSVFSSLGGLASLTTLSSINEDGFLFGAMLCLGEFAGNMFVPTCAPVVLIKMNVIEDKKERVISPGDEVYQDYRQLLTSVSEKKFAVFKAFS